MHRCRQPRLAANLSFLFQERDYLSRFDAAAACGFRGVEFLFPYDWPADTVADTARAAGLTVALFNLPPGDWAAGDRGVAALPGREAEFRQGLDLALRYAETIGTTTLHVMAGVMPAGAGHAGAHDAVAHDAVVHDDVIERMHSTYCRNLAYAAAQVPDTVTLTIEPINRRDMPGYFLESIEQAVAVLDAVNSPRLKLQFDIYHAQNVGGDLARRLEAHMGRIGHIQIAGNPGRHEPDIGEINYPFLFNLLEQLGYDGWVGCEYKPADTAAGGTAAGLGWAADYGLHRLAKHDRG